MARMLEQEMKLFVDVSRDHKISKRSAGQLQTGLPFSSRRTSVSLPVTTSRARIRSASPCSTLEPVRAISSPLLKLTPMSSRVEKGLGGRDTGRRCPSPSSPAWEQPLSHCPLGAVSFPPPSFHSCLCGRNFLAIRHLQKRPAQLKKRRNSTAHYRVPVPNWNTVTL